MKHLVTSNKQLYIHCSMLSLSQYGCQLKKSAITMGSSDTVVVNPELSQPCSEGQFSMR